MSQGFPSNEPGKLPPYGAAGGVPNPYGTTGGPSGSYSPGPYGAGPGPTFGGTENPPKKDRSGCIAASIVAGILGVGVLCCGGCSGVFYFILDAQFKETARQLSVDYRNDPKVKEEVGEIQDVTVNWGATLNRGEENESVYDVRGDKGSAQFVVEEEEPGVILSARLQNDRGEWELPSDGATNDETDHDRDHGRSP